MISCTGAPKELEVFTEYYPKLRSILPISSISPQLVAEKIIGFTDDEEISKIPTTTEKAAHVLRKIGLQLESGITQSFYSLLDIMEKYGGDVATHASRIRRALLCK